MDKASEIETNEYTVTTPKVVQTDSLDRLKPWQRVLVRVLCRYFQQGKPSIIVLQWNGFSLVPLDTNQIDL